MNQKKINLIIVISIFTLHITNIINSQDLSYSLSYKQSTPESNPKVGAFPWISPDGNHLYFLHTVNVRKAEIMHRIWDNQKNNFGKAETVQIDLSKELTGFWFSNDQSQVFVLTREGELWNGKQIDKLRFGNFQLVKVQISTLGILSNPSFTTDLEQMYLFSSWALW